MWHMEIQEGQLADVRRTVQEQAEAARRSLQMRADEQLRQEKEAYRKAERNRLLRIRWAAPARGPCLATSSRWSGSHRLEPRPFPAGAPPPPRRSPGPTDLPASPASPARFPLQLLPLLPRPSPFPSLLPGCWEQGGRGRRTRRVPAVGRGVPVSVQRHLIRGPTPPHSAPARPFCRFCRSSAPGSSSAPPHPLGPGPREAQTRPA